MLHLFGFQLPETHHRYLLASSFTDYWRRINIYWKDFMVRVVFNPVAFRLKRWPQPVALAAATVAVFVVTWLLHAYQSYWLRGAWGFGVPDALFWGILGVLVLINVQLDARRGGRRTAARRGHRRRLACRVLRVAGTFATITLLWSLWSSPSLAAWVGLLRRVAGLIHRLGDAVRSAREGEAPAEPRGQARPEPRPPEDRTRSAGFVDELLFRGDRPSCRVDAIHRMARLHIGGMHPPYGIRRRGNSWPHPC